MKYPTSKSAIDPKTGRQVLPAGAAVLVNIEDFEKILRPELVDVFEQQGYCWVVVGSTQRGRAEASRRSVPHALAYYARARARARRSRYEVSPYAKGKGPVKFNFDWTFDYYPLAYNRPGPEMTIYRLQGGALQAEVAAAAGVGRTVPLSWRAEPYAADVPLLTAADHDHLARAIELAEFGLGRVHPNPMVGALLVRDGEVLGEGWHDEYGGPHAEVNAIADADGRGLDLIAGRDALRLDGAVLPSRQDAAVHRRDPRRRHRARRRRLRRPEREGVRPRPGDPARRGRRGRGRRRRDRARARGSSTRRSASTRAPAARGCCSSPR